MAVRALALSGLAALGLGLIALGSVFDEPGDHARNERLPTPPAALRLGTWQPAVADIAPVAASAPAAGAVSPSETETVEPIPDDFTAPTNVWATPAEWSDED